MRVLPPRGQCPPGIRPLGFRRLDYHQLAIGISPHPELSEHWKWSQGERGHEREQ